METITVLRAEEGRGDTLETSLVEWKLGGPVRMEVRGWFLGNFLSGMETWIVFGDGRMESRPWKLP